MKSGPAMLKHWCFWIDNFNSGKGQSLRKAYKSKQHKIIILQKLEKKTQWLTKSTIRSLLSSLLNSLLRSLKHDRTKSPKFGGTLWILSKIPARSLGLLEWLLLWSACWASSYITFRKTSLCLESINGFTEGLSIYKIFYSYYKFCLVINICVIESFIFHCLIQCSE